MSGEFVDTHKLNHLTMWIDNDGDLYRQQYQPIIKNLMTKRARGVFDRAKAEKLWMYLMESGAKKLCKEFPEDYPRPWHVEFNMATLKAAAKEFNDTFMHDAEHGDYDSLLPKKYQPKAVRHAIRKIAGGKRRHAGARRRAAAAPYAVHVWEPGSEVAHVTGRYSSKPQAVKMAKRHVARHGTTARVYSDVSGLKRLWASDVGTPSSKRRRAASKPASGLGAVVADINRLMK